jgi:pimeloyl-ACP methyl ester carboxylesterase
MNYNPMLEKTDDSQYGSVSAAIHRIITEDGCELALTRLNRAAGGPTRPPVILLHGSYSRRNFWLSPKGVGLGAYLHEDGFDVWIPELRGHGLSPKGDRYKTITAEDQIRFDLPAIQAYVCSETDQSVFWVAHSFGGVFLAASQSAGWLNTGPIRGMVTFGSQISRGERYLKIPLVGDFLCFLLNIIGVFPASRFGLGPEVESAGTMTEIIRWKKRGGSWRNSDGHGYWDGMGRVRAPLLAFAGAADRNDPPEGCRIMAEAMGSSDKTIVVLGREEGFSMDYDHVGMVVSKSSAADVWPMVRDWMQRRSV